MVAAMDRPVLRCFVSFPITDELFSATALVSLDTAVLLKEAGYMVVGPDPQDEQELASWDRAHPWFLRPSNFGT